jgi:3-deoxy-D-manno-octulosonic-acid transferase
MFAPLRPLYASAVALARAVAAAVPAPATNDAGASKLRRSLSARRGLVASWRAQATTVRDPKRPLVWMHAPSVGEGLQARPVAHALRDALPDAQLAYSFFSPSAERFAATIGADLAGYLPFDSATDADAMLDALQPSVLVFVKLDVWPVLVERARRRGVPVMMLSATLAETSGRRGRWSRALLHDAYASMALVGVIDAEHGERLVDLGVSRHTIRHTGDTRFDQVLQRVETVDTQASHMRVTRSDRPTLVAGSTWPADEAVLLPALLSARAAHPALRMIIAPHEPTPAHVEPLLTWAATHGLSTTSLSEAERGGGQHDADVVVVDRVGVLGDLYAHADVAFVGGGFHRAGLHSAIEPAAFGAPVLFGPRYHMSREAGLLLAAGGARAVTRPAELATSLQDWLTSDITRRQAGASARATVESERGATARSVALVRSLLG